MQRNSEDMVNHFLGQRVKEWLSGLNKRHELFKNGEERF